MTGRGAWPRNGAGGTLSADGTGPGYYYRLPADDTTGPRVGSGGPGATDVNLRAVHFAVKAIQRQVNRALPDHEDVKVTGVYGPRTRDAVSIWQQQVGLPSAGTFGPLSAKALFLPQLQRLVPADLAYVVCGLVTNESAWDPAAVGASDEHDLGLAQINGPAHPDYSEAERLSPAVAFTFAHGRLLAALDEFSGDLRDAVASYNLGGGGARSWIRAGRPDSWTPVGSSTPRDVKGYIDRILTACEGIRS